MSKKFFSKMIIALTGVVVAVLWLLSIVIPDTFGFFNLSWAIAIFAGVCGVVFILKGFCKDIVVAKKFNVCFGTILLVISFVSIYGAIKLPESYVIPIIGIILSVGVMFSIFVVGGKKWDQGDNKNVGYKNYYERKKEGKKEDK